MTRVTARLLAAAAFAVLAFQVNAKDFEHELTWTKFASFSPATSRMPVNDAASKSKKKASLRGLNKQQTKHLAKNAEKLDQIHTGSVKSSVFGSLAIRFSSAASQAKWQRVETVLRQTSEMHCDDAISCSEKPGLYNSILSKAAPLSFFNKLRSVNTQVNEYIRYQDDKITYRQADYWALPQESWKHQLGDCEDYVILKMSMLKQLGVPSRSMSMVVVKDTRRDLHHAVLAIHTNKGIFILDNVQRNVMLDAKLKHYMPLFSFSEYHSWIHGKRVTPGERLVSKPRPLNIANVIPGGSDQDVQLETISLSALDFDDIRPISAD